MKNILVVDDNPANIGLLFDCLNHAGFKTLVAQDGESAVRTARRVVPDLILLDVIMPEMDGFATCAALKEDAKTADIPVFFMTALTDTESKVRGFECGAVDFISKPFHQEEVLARIHAHLTIQEQKKSLTMANHIKEKVISVVAHDLKNPFTAIFAYIQMLQKNYDKYDDKKRKAYIDKLEHANRDLYGLLESLLKWVSTGEGKLEYSPQAICMENLVESAWDATKALAIKKAISLTREMDKDACVEGDKNMMAAVIRNLLTNAFKFTPRSGRVGVTVAKKGDMVILSVSDTGMGMDRSQVEIIEAGGKIHSTSGTEKESGTGMGLVICLEFIRMMDGSLAIESEPGRGSCFTIQFPAARAGKQTGG